MTDHVHREVARRRREETVIRQANPHPAPDLDPLDTDQRIAGHYCLDAVRAHLQERDVFTEGQFVEVFVDAPIEECERRDPKGLYAQARGAALPNFTGIDRPYEPPEAPAVHLPTTGRSPEAWAEQVFARLP